MNDHGQVVGESATDAGFGHAFSWTRAGGMVDLGTLGGCCSEARAVNDRGEIAGNSTTGPGSTDHAVLWTPVPR